MNTIKCKNCNTEFSGNYCNNCSQASNTERINFKFILTEIQKTFIHFDSGFLYTTKKLFTNPGEAILSYINGARIKHFRPLSFLFFIAGAYLILINSAHLTLIKESISSNAKYDIEKYIKEYYIQIQLSLIFIYSILSVLLFHYRHLNLYEFIIMHTYLAGQRILINILFLPLLLWNKTTEYASYINYIELLIGIIYMTWTYVNIFSHKNTFVIILKTIALQLIIFVMLILVLQKVI